MTCVFEADVLKGTHLVTEPSWQASQRRLAAYGRRPGCRAGIAIWN